MSQSPATRRLSVFRIIRILLTGYLIGFTTAALTYYFQPKFYESEGVLIDAFPLGGSTGLSAGHAAMTVSNLELHRRWGTSFEEAIPMLQERIGISSEEGVTKICGQFESASDARQVVRSLMVTFQGIDRERQWSDVEDFSEHYTLKDIENQKTIRKLITLIHESLADHERFAPGSLITESTIQGMANEDLVRQIKAYQDLAHPPGRFGPPDGRLVVPPSVLAEPIELMMPVSPNLGSYLLTGRIGGLIFGTLMIAFFRYRHPILIEVPLLKNTRSPDWARPASTLKTDRSPW